jgi:hypothetical protein
MRWSKYLGASGTLVRFSKTFHVTLDLLVFLLFCFPRLLSLLFFYFLAVVLIAGFETQD